MDKISSLTERIDAEFAAAQRRLEEFRTQHVHEFQDKQERLEQFEKALDGLRSVWEPRLNALASKFGDRVDVHPTIDPGRRSVSFKFRSSPASISLRLSVSPDVEVRKLVFSYDVEILPILMIFDSHVQLEQPLDAIDELEFAEWLDDRIVDFVRTYLAIHEDQYYLKGHLVEDPIAKVQFPKFTAAATLEQNGETLYFIDESTLREFKKRNNERHAGSPQNNGSGVASPTLSA